MILYPNKNEYIVIDPREVEAITVDPADIPDKNEVCFYMKSAKTVVCLLSDNISQAMVEEFNSRFHSTEEEKV